jgi:Beta-propeller repeat/Cep192 domain 4/Divergent InlB B-repeat domain
MPPDAARRTGGKQEFEVATRQREPKKHEEETDMKRNGPAFRRQSCFLVSLVFPLLVLGSVLPARALPPQASAAKPGPGAAASARTTAAALRYASYLASTADRTNAVAVGPDGTVYVAGVTLASSATASDPAKTTGGEGNAFVARLSADGSRLLYFIYLGKSGLDEARAIAVDAAGNAYVTGETRAVDFPVLNPFQSRCGVDASGQCSGDAFVAEVNPQGALLFSTYLGGSGEDAGNAIAVDAAGNIYVAGSTASTDFPIFNPAQASSAGQGDAFIAKLGPGGSLVYSTYLGGSGADEARGIAVDAAGNVYVTGQTTSADFPVRNALQPACRPNAKNVCAGEAFATMLSADGSTFLYSTYLGGSGGDAGNTIAVDAAGNAYIAGVSGSADFPVAKPLKTALSGTSDAFVAKLSPDGAKLLFSTYLGGSGDDQADAIAVDSAGDVLVSGWTHSADFPTHNPIQAACQKDRTGACSVDAFLATLDPTGAKLMFSSYLGGSGMDASRALAIDTQGAAYLGGWTTSSDFPQAKAPLAPTTSSASSADPVSSTTTTTSAPTSTSTSTSTSTGASSGSFVTKVSGVAATSSTGGSSPSPNTTVTCSGSDTWTGGASNDLWASAGNWSSGAVPVSTDTVCISGQSAITITIGALATANQTIASLTDDANISFTSGPLTITGSADFANNLTVSGGTLTLGGATTVGGTLNFTGGTLADNSTLGITGLFTWSGGTLGGTGTTTANGGITIPNGGNVTLDVETLDLPASTTLTLGNSSGFANLSFQNGAVLNIASGATFNNENGNGVNYGGGTINNSGTFEMTGSGTTDVSTVFNNETGGTVSVTSGTLIMGGTTASNPAGGGTCGSACPGSWSAASGTTLTFAAATSYTYAISGTMSGAGTVNFNGSMVNFTGTYNITGATNTGGGTVNFNSGATVTSTGPLTITFGTMNFSTGQTGGITLPSLTQSNGTLGGSDNFTVSGLITWSFRGTICGAITSGSCNSTGTPGTINANGGILLPGNNITTFDLRTVNVAPITTPLACPAASGTVPGTVCQGDSSNTASLVLNDGSVVNNAAGATWIVQDYGGGTNQSSINGGAGGTFNNNGAFDMVADNGNGAAQINVPFNNNTGASVSVTGASSALSLNDGASCGGTCAGTWSAGAGATLQFNGGTFALSGPISGAGTLLFSAGIANLTGTYNVTGATRVEDTGTYVNFNSGATITSFGPLSVINNGTLNLSSGTSGGITVPTLTMSPYPGGTLGGTDNVTVTGLSTWGAGTICSAMTESMSGDTCNSTGTLAVINANGGITVATGNSVTVKLRTLNISGSATIGSSSGGDNFNLANGAVVNLLAGATWSMPSGGNLNGGATETFNNSGTFTVAAATSSAPGGTPPATMPVYPVFNNNSGAAVSVTSGTLAFNGGGSCGSTCPGTWTAGTGATLSFSGGTYPLTGTINGAGTVNFNGATVNVDSPAVYNVTGTTSITNGTASFNSGVTVTSVGALTAHTNSGTLNFSTGQAGGITLASFSEIGSFIFVGGTDNITVTGLFTLGQGFLCGPLTESTSGTSCDATGTEPALNITSGSFLPNVGINGQEQLRHRIINDSGTVTFGNSTTGSSLFLFSAAVINNLSTATWNFVNGGFEGTGNPSGVLAGDTAANAFNNAGTVETTTTATQTQVVSVAFTNTGMVSAGAGTLTVSGAYTQTAGATILAGGTFTFNAPNPPGPPSIQGGVFSGSGTATGTVLNPGGAVAPGSSTAVGAITIANSSIPSNYTQGSGGAFDLKVGGTSAGQFDTLAVGGAAALNGALNVSTIGGFTPTVGQAVMFMTYASETGTFSSVTSGWCVTYNTTSAVATYTNASCSPTTNFALTVTLAGTGSGTVTSSPTGVNCTTGSSTGCSANFSSGTMVTLTAAAASGSTFAGWSGNAACSGTGTCTITMNAAQSVTATFTLQTFALSVTDAGTGSGTVTSSPTGINCTTGSSTGCAANFSSGTMVTLTAAAASGSTFAGWSGNAACSGTGTCTITMNAAQAVTATFNVSGAPATTFSLGNLMFGDQDLGATSGSQMVTLTNSGNATLNIMSIALTGTNPADFTQSNTCGTSVDAAHNCVFTVTFTPTAVGTRAASITIIDNAAGSPQTVSLSGTGVDFSLSATPGSSQASAGGTATYTVMVTPMTGGFPNQVSLSASGAPAGATVSFSPPSVTPGNNPATSTLTIQLAAAKPAAGAALPLPGSGEQPGPFAPAVNPPLLFGLLFLLLLAAALTMGLLGKARPAKALRPRKLALAGVFLFALAGLLAGCEGGFPTPPAQASTRFTVTISGASASLHHSTTVTLTVMK